MTATRVDPQSGGEEPEDVEPRVLDAAATGALLDLRIGDGTGRGAGRVVRAGLLVDLLTGERGRPRAVKLRGARITGEFDLEAAELGCPLLLADCLFEEPVGLCECSASTIRLPGCRLPGLAADRACSTGDLDLDGVAVEGTVALRGAEIGGGLSFAGARLSNPQGHALTADSLTIEHDLDCRDLTVEGEIHLRGAAVGGTLNFGRARLNASGGDALAAARLTVGHDAFCHDLVVDGEVRLPGARVGGRLTLNHARLANPGGAALTADRLSAEDGVLGEELMAEGEVRLPGARIGAALVLAGARLVNPGGRALNADGLVVEQHVHATGGFTAEGETRLAGARIGGSLDLSGSVADGRLDLGGINAGALVLLPRHRLGDVDLADAGVGVFDDDPDTWPTSIRLRGFTYDRLGPSGDKAGVRTRLRWIARDPGGYVPQLYDQLAAAYRRAGDEQAARTVAVAKQRRRRAVLNPAGKLANWLLYLTVGYGYRTWLAAVWLAGLFVLGTWIFADAHPHDLARADKNAPAFNAFGYTVDILLPIVDLGQQKAWRAEGAAMYWSWVFIAAGWVLTTAVVAGLTGILKRN